MPIADAAGRKRDGGDPMRTTRRVTRRWRRALLGAFGLGLFLLAPMRAEAADPEAQAIMDGLELFADGLAAVEDLEHLANAIPYTGVKPTDATGLNLAGALRQGIKDQLASASAGTIADLDARLDDIDGNSDPNNDGTIGGVLLDVTGAITPHTAGAPAYDITLTVDLDRDVAVPLDMVAGAATLKGGTVNLDLAASTTLAFRLDTAAAPADAFTLSTANAPKIDVDADALLTATGSGFTADLGLALVNVQGTADFGADLVARIVDPDNSGQITADELGATAPGDLFDVAYEASRATANLNLTTTGINGLSGAAATVTLNDTDLANGVDTPNLDLGGLADFTNVSPLDFLSGIAQAAAGIEALAVSGPLSLDLPFVKQATAEIVHFNDRIAKFFVDTGLTTEDNPLQLGAAPAALEQYNTIQEIAPALATALGVPVADLAFAFDPATHRLSWNILATETDQAFAEDPPTIEIDLANELSGIGIIDVDNASTAVTITPDYTLDLGLGFNLGSVPTPVLDRVQIETTGTELVADLAVDANLDLAGRIGFLGVRLNDSNTSGPVRLLGPSTAGTSMLTLDIADSDGWMTITELMDRIADNTLLSGGSFAVNASVPTTVLTAKALSGSTPIAQGDFTVSWPDVTTGLPSVTPSGTFESQLLDFDFDRSNPLALFNSIMASIEQVAAGIDALSGSNPVLGQEIPVIGRSFDSLANQLTELREAVEATVNDPSATLQLLETRLESELAELLAVADAKAASLIDLNVVPGTASAPTSVRFSLDYSLCSQDATCADTIPASMPFNLSLGDGNGGIVGATAGGSVNVDLRATSSLDFGFDLPAVTPGATGVAPTVDGALVPYLLDSTSAALAVNLTTPVELQAKIGPVTLNVGTAADPGLAKVGASIVLDNDDADDKVLMSELDSFISGMAPTDISPTPQLSCAGVAGGPYDACASLPVYRNGTHLGTITFHASDLADLSTYTFNGLPQVLQALIAQGFDFQTIVQGFEQVLAMLQSSLDAAAYGTSIPVVGDGLTAGARVVETFNTKVVQPAGALATTLQTKTEPSQLEFEIRKFFTDNLAPTGQPSLIVDRDGAPGTTPGDITLTMSCDDGQAAGASGADTTTGRMVCNDSMHNANHLYEVTVGLALGQSAETQAPSFDIGLPGLRLAVEDDDPGSSVDDLVAEASWRLDLNFGISIGDGFFLQTDNPINPGQPEALITAGVEMPDTIRGDLAFLPITITDKTTPVDDPSIDPNAPADLNLRVGANLTGGGLDSRISLSELLGGMDPTNAVDLTIGGGVHLALHLATGFLANDVGSSGTPQLPRFDTDFYLDWSWSDGPIENLDSTTPAIRFEEVKVDMGTLLGGFMKPIFNDIEGFLKPARGIVDVVTAPIPGVAEIAEIVGEEAPTLLTLFEAQGGDTQVIRRIAELIQMIDTLRAVSTGGGVDLGRFDLNASLARGGALSPQQKDQLVVGTASGNPLGTALGGAKSVIDRARTDKGGFSFPALQDPTQLFQLLVGKDVTLVQWDAGLLKAQASKTLKFGPPIGICPCSAGIVISFGIEGHFEVGYDTRGIREAVRRVVENDGTAISTVASLFQGVFIADLRNGVDVPEISLFGKVAVQAALDVLVAEAGIRAGIAATLDLNLHDGGRNPTVQDQIDGKLYIDEMFRHLSNPICLFDASGAFSVFVELYADTFLSPEVTHTLVGPINIVEFPDLTSFCDKKPDLGHVDDGFLYLHMGDLFDLREVDEGVIDEQMVVRQTGATEVSISGFGFQEVETGVTKGVVVDGKDGNDKVVLLAGGSPGLESSGDTTTQATLPLIFCGGAGDDIAMGAGGVDHLYGDAKRSGAGCVAGTGSGSDKLVGAGAGDVIRGGPGGDNLVGAEGADDIDGERGNDTILGNAGADTLRGGPELGFGADVDTIIGGDGADTIHGGIGNDKLEGEKDGDTINGGRGADELIGGDGADTLNGNLGNDILRGGADGDILNGDDGHDDLFGDAGSDTLNGGKGHDDLIGNADASTSALRTGDTLNGGDGIDFLLGDDGAISRAPGDEAGSISPVAGPGAFAGNDLLRGEADADTIHGGQGDDDIAGAGGIDLLHGDGGADLIHGDAEGDKIFGDDGNDELYGDDGVDIMRGGKGADRMFGNAEGDEMHGDSGADVMLGNLGADTMRGGIDGDCMAGNEDEDTMLGDGGADRMAGGSATAGAGDVRDHLFGGGDADVIAGDNASLCDGVLVLLDVPFVGTADAPTTYGPDEIVGGDGDDFLYGQSAFEHIDGGLGNDHIEGNEGADVLLGNAGDDDITGGSGFDFGGPGGSKRRLEGVRDENVGGVGDTLRGNAGVDFLAGDNAELARGANGRTLELYDVDFAGDAVVVSAQTSGNDLIEGGDGMDTMYGQGAADRIFGQAHDDYAEGNSAIDVIDGGAGDDDLMGGSGRDNGNGGYRELNGALDDADEIRGGDGHDVALGDNANVTRTGGVNPSNGAALRLIRLYDVELAGAPAVDPDVHGDEVLMTGDAGDDLMFGQGGNDVLDGSTGNDDVEGNHGSDLVDGGPGQDDLAGGGSANDGVIDADRVPDGLLDEGDLLSGESGELPGLPEGSGGDVMVGDNARITRLTDAAGAWSINTFNGTFVRDVLLGDVELVDGPVIAAVVHGDDRLFGNDNDDTMWGQGGQDYLRGGAGDDFLQGNHDVDTLFGDSEGDDVAGGSFAPGRLDAGDFVYGDSNDDGSSQAGDGHDVMVGDNALVVRPLEGGAWVPIVYGNGTKERVTRIITMLDTAGPGLASGSDVMRGGGADDDMVGQYDDGAASLLANVKCYGLATFASVHGDLMCGDEGEDAMVGDLGTIVDRSEDDGTRERVVKPEPPFVADVIFERGSLTRIVTLQELQQGGNDLMFGGPDGDWMHGGAGADLMNGNTGDDRIFGDDGPDAAWGGVGHDHLFGGWGADYLDVNPRLDDPLDWKIAAPIGDTYEDIDYIYGGWDADAMQANIGGTGPVPGDRLVDWVGGYNAYYTCPAAYGERVITRMQSPGLVRFLNELALGDGAVDTATPGTSGYREVGIVQHKESGLNSNPPHADHPAHFTCT